jgi:hypothetical protein
MLKPTGPAFSAVAQGVETGAAAGPIGAVVGGLVGLLSQSETFQNAMASLETIFQQLADSVGVLVEPLMPLLVVVGEVAAGLGALIEALSPIIEFVARPLFEVLKTFGIVVLSLVRLIGEIINSFVTMFGGKGFDLSGVGKALGKLEAATYDSAKEQQKVADAARAAAEGTANVPAWWMADQARFSAVGPESTRAPTSGGEGGGSTVYDSSTYNINVTSEYDPVAVAEEVMDKIAEKKSRKTSSKYGDMEVP